MELVRNEEKRAEYTKRAKELEAENCRILPSALGDAIGDYAAVSVGYMGLKNEL